MRKLVFAAILAGIVMTGCKPKESGNKSGCLDGNMTEETVELASCEINIGGIHFTKSKNGAEKGISAHLTEVSSIVLQSFSQKLTTPSLSLSQLKFSRNSPKPEHILPAFYTHTKLTPTVKNCVSNRTNTAITA